MVRHLFLPLLISSFCSDGSQEQAFNEYCISLVHPDWQGAFCLKTWGTKGKFPPCLTAVVRMLWVQSSWLQPGPLTGDLFFLREGLGGGSWEGGAGSRVFRKAAVINSPPPDPPWMSQTAEEDYQVQLWEHGLVLTTHPGRQWREVWAESS